MILLIFIHLFQNLFIIRIYRTLDQILIQHKKFSVQLIPNFTNLYKITRKNRGTRPGFSYLLYSIFYAALFHPIKNLIRDFKADSRLLLRRQGVACVLQCGEACVWQGFECFLRSGDWHDIVVFAVIDMHRNP